MKRLGLAVSLGLLTVMLAGCGGGGGPTDIGNAVGDVPEVGTAAYDAWKASFGLSSDGGAKLAKLVHNPTNAFLSLHIWDNTEAFYPHHFDLGNVAGDPGNPVDDNRGLLYPFPTAALPHSYTTIRVDGTDYRYGVDGTYVSGPAYVGGGMYESVMTYASGDIEVTQRFQFEPFDPGVDARALRIEYECFHAG